MPATRPLRGAFTALVTPFNADGSIDQETFRSLVRRQIDSCIHGMVACGTTGETPTLSHEEDEWVIGTTVEIAAERPSRERLRIIAGTGSNSTETAIRSTRRAAALGVDAALVVAPYYNKPDQRMMEAHFRAVADEGDLPIIVYNIPGRTGVNIEAATLLRLAEHPRIVAVKEASSNMDQIQTILRERPANFSFLSGDDNWTLPTLAMGGDGVISTTSNEIPAEMAEMCDAAFAGDWEQARRIHARWLPLMRANFTGGPNPVPVKAAMAMMGLLQDNLRMPLMPLEEPHRARLRMVLETTGLLDLEGEASSRVQTDGDETDGDEAEPAAAKGAPRLAIVHSAASRG